jgi:formate/nitrite transporter
MSASEGIYNSLSPAEIANKAENIGVDKTCLSIRKMTLLGILAGAYIAFGAVFSSISVTGMSEVWPYGITRIYAGLTFSLGLILVVIAGAELFTGNNLMLLALLRKKITLKALLRNWIVVYLSNFLGSIIVALMVIGSKLYQSDNGELGKTMLSIANSKSGESFWPAFILGILCNILVCLAVWMSYSAQTTGGKILAIIFPITAFIAAGFEHSVANMYILSLGLLLQNIDPSFVTGLGIVFTHLTLSNALINNLIPVTLGNIIGGAGFVAGIYAAIYNQVSSDK